MTTDPRLHRIVAAQPYPLIFATISGAHLYGFPSPDSDFDLRGVHVLPLPRVLGLDLWDETVQEERSIEGLEMDIVSHDVRKFFNLLLKKNGYVLEQLFSPLIVHTTPEHAELKAICNPRQVAPTPSKSGDGTSQTAPPGDPERTTAVPSPGGEGQGESGRIVFPPGTQILPSVLNSPPTGVITRHHSHHYLGFAETQWRLFEKERPRRVKPLLYVYRVLLTGIHLMRTGRVEANLVTLNETFRLPFLPGLIARKLAGPEQSTLPDADLAFHETEYQRLRAELQAAHAASPLPELPDEATRAALNDLLVRIRLSAVRPLPE
jgi:predicted nucleotidyltransferase